MKTLLDQRFEEMEAAEEEIGARLRFYQAFLMAELFLALEAPAEGDVIRPQVFPLEGGDTILVFDHESRMADFLGDVEYLTLSGRQLLALLEGRRLCIGLNLGPWPSATVLPAEALDWMGQLAGNAPAEVMARPVEFRRPKDLPEGLVAALDVQIAASRGLAEQALLAEALYDDGRRGLLLGISGAIAEAEAGLRLAINEAVAFQTEETALDILFLRPGDPLVQPLGRAGLAFDFPRAASAVPRKAPGSDPSDPPKLR